MQLLDKSEIMNKQLIMQYGELMDSRSLMHVLGYKSCSTFKLAITNKTLGIKVFDVPGRRGKFALTRHVSSWLSQLAAKEPS